MSRPPENHKAIEFLSTTGPDSLKKQKVSIQSFSGIWFPFSRIKIKNVVRVGPPLKKLLDSSMSCLNMLYNLTILKIGPEKFP